MDETTFNKVIELITQRIGIIPRDSHKIGIRNYIDKRIAELKASDSDDFNYYDFLISDSDEMMNLINSATVNETYFFREEAQFDLLKNKVLPQIKETKPLLPIRIWSAASSSGEEIYSICLLAASMNIRTDCTASDINTRVLEICRKGEYKKNAVRTVDGSKYHELLSQYKQQDGTFIISKHIRDKITLKQINLSKMQDYPKNQDIVFLRNVFIYFSQEMKKQILKKIVDEALVPGGYLFVSMNEVAALDASTIPSNLEKISDGKIFYFHKKMQVVV